MLSHLYTYVYFFKSGSRRPPPRPEEKPVASIRPSQSTPLPMMPRQASANSAPIDDSSGGFPVNCLEKAGVSVQKIVTTTGRQLVHVAAALNVFYLLKKKKKKSHIPYLNLLDIVIPGTNSSTDVQARITAGESIHIIRGTKG